MVKDKHISTLKKIGTIAQSSIADMEALLNAESEKQTAKAALKQYLNSLQTS